MAKGKKLNQKDCERIAAALVESGGVRDKAAEWLRGKGYSYGNSSIDKVLKSLRNFGATFEYRPETPPPFDAENPVARADLIRVLRRNWSSASRLAERFSVSEESIREAIDHLEERGYQILWDEPRVRITKFTELAGLSLVDGSPVRDGWRRFGLIGDTHLASKFCRLDVLNAAYDRFAEEGISEVYHAGNIVDGESRYNQFELLAHGIADQAIYVVDNYPRRRGITTYFISGDCHEGWWRNSTGIDFGRYLQFEAADAGREDLIYLGYMEADVELRMSKGSAFLRLFHPGGGSSYAHSYAVQKIIESFQGGEKPGMLACGHYHKSLYDMVRNVHTFQVGCTQDQTPFQRKKKIEAALGFWVVGVQQDDRGSIRRVRQEWTGFYDRSYHALRTA